MTKLASIVFALNLFACATDPQTGGGGGGTCGDNKCDADETATTCPEDCKPNNPCGNGTCDSGETTATCPADCPAPVDKCGDSVCGNTETPSSCPGDCAAQFKVSNSSTATIDYIYAWACGASNTYANLLNGTLPPGYYVEYDTFNPGCWNFEVYTTANQTASQSNVQLKERVLTTWTLN